MVFDRDNLSEACLDDLQKYFWTRSIKLDKPEQDETDPQIHRGNGTLLNVACQIEVFSKADQSLLILCARPLEAPNFGTCFPLMPGESETGNSADSFFLRFVTLQDPLWLYVYPEPLDEQTLQAELDKLGIWQEWSSRNQPSLPTENGLNMWGGLLPDLPGLDTLIDFIEIDLSEFLVQSKVTFPDEFPILTLLLTIGPEGFPFGPGTLKDAEVKLSSPLYFSPNDSQICLEGTLDFNDGQQGIDIKIDFPRDGDLITAIGTYRNNTLPFINPSDVADLPSLPPQSDVTVDLQFSKQKKSLEQASFTLDLESWPVIEDVLTLDGLLFNFSVDEPLDAKIITASIDAQATLGKDSQITLLGSGYYPSNQFYFGLDTQTPVKIADFVADLGAPSDGIPDLTINELSTEFNLNSEELIARVDVSGTWEIINNVELNALRFKIYGQATYSCEIAAELSIAGIALNLEANYDGDAWQFNGSTGQGQAIPIGPAAQQTEDGQSTLAEDLGNIFGDVPLPAAIEDLTIQNLAVSFNSETKDFTFTAESQLVVDDRAVDITVIIDITRQEDNSFLKQFGGYITVGDLQFNLLLTQDKKVTTLLAAYNNPDRQALKVRNLVETVSTDIAAYVPTTLEITLLDALFIYSKDKSKDQSSKNQSKSQVFFGLNLSSTINFTKLPLVGKDLPADRTIGIDNLQFLLASQNLTPDTIDGFNTLLPEDMAPIPYSLSPEASAPAVKRGLTISATLQLGDTLQVLTLPIAANESSSASLPDAPTLDVPAIAEPAIDEPDATEPVTAEIVTDEPVTDSTQWYPLNKRVGPLHLARIGVQYQDDILWFRLDAAIATAGLSLTLDGLSVGSPIKQFQPKFQLQGLGVSYESKGTLSIKGALLRTTVEGRDEYSGAIIVKTKTFTIAALGSYTNFNGHPSLFIYGILNKPLGGPPFFYITGLALGFAYNRELIPPTLDEIPQFPLVRAALNRTPADPTELNALQQDLRPSIPPKVGRIMLAVGIKFTSFKIIESFVLLVASFGDQFTLDLFGLSTLISPPLPPNKNVPPLAQVRFAIVARFAPAEGILQVEGKILPDSYLFDRDCRLSGGFAFYTWFSGPYKGDFVLTVGGYHPRFQVPEHYPRVDPLALNWRISQNLNVKGSLYFALTASAIMAGGRLEANWKSGRIKAWFVAYAHFIVSWQPYFYDARIGVNLGGSYSFRIFRRTRKISIQVGADLHIWGPKFSGTARVSLWIVSFTVRFGSRSRQKPPALDWPEFKQSFLPSDQDVCTLAVESGLLRKIGEGDSEIFVVNPKDFALTASSVIPIKTTEAEQVSIQLQTDSGATPQTTTFGIASMGVKNRDFTESKYHISLTKIGADGREVSQESGLTCVPIAKNVPAGLWGESNTTDPTREGLINNVLSGYTVKPAKPPQPGVTQSIERKNIAYDTESIANAYQWQPGSVFAKSEEADEDAREQTIGKSITSETVENSRTRLLKRLGLSDVDIADMDLEDFETPQGIERAFIIAPQLETATV
ncbi:hypothetical protein IQ254_12145 [Nodosilinea sp. LEGE 07088]|uniref:DUF6603 domain-containing protein n=1 Tax=Nodosilinea sp. LEGE 07088 TaxID=2777968 RepID=UPI00187EFFD0|nr:DUF6603 domain-containing protein [Nodosilinea sp. LEGE 07088]MBE9137934.1 hypothetical protein [Nodosilinea sp. LEGE 07088]